MGRTEYPKATPALLEMFTGEEYREPPWSAQQNLQHMSHNTDPLSPSFPKDEEPEGDACYSREKPQMADDIEGRVDFSGSGWFLLADSCCSNPWDGPKAQPPTGNFRYLQKAILNTM